MATGESRALTSTAAYDEGPDWSPDSKESVWTSAGVCYRARADGSEAPQAVPLEAPAGRSNGSWRPSPLERTDPGRAPDGSVVFLWRTPRGWSGPSRGGSRELYASTESGAFYSVPVDDASGYPLFGTPRKLFDLPVVGSTTYSFAVGARGERFLFPIEDVAAEHQALSVLLNWGSRLKAHP